MDEENKIKDGEIVSEEAPAEAGGKEKKRKDLYVELALFFILGVLIGITLKTEAVKRITMGYNDYRMEIKKQDYNINKLQTDLTKKSAEESQSSEPQDSATENTENQSTNNAGEPSGQVENENPKPGLN